MNYILSNPKLFPFQPRLCRPSNDNRAFRRVRGDRFPTQTWPETRHPQPHCPSFRQKGFQLHHREAPFLVLGKH